MVCCGPSPYSRLFAFDESISTESLVGFMRCMPGDGNNSADQRWSFWPLLPLGFQLLEQV
ncbi:hypothetical protein SynA1544_01257 [Synechococcus sp. A15-44]|nr:hypothetical protein SynA1544_01257 [Synechococcus sp. A15-44]